MRIYSEGNLTKFNGTYFQVSVHRPAVLLFFVFCFFLRCFEGYGQPLGGKMAFCL